MWELQGRKLTFIGARKPSKTASTGGTFLTENGSFWMMAKAYSKKMWFVNQEMNNGEGSIEQI